MEPWDASWDPKSLGLQGYRVSGLGFRVKLGARAEQGDAPKPAAREELFALLRLRLLRQGRFRVGFSV